MAISQLNIQPYYPISQFYKAKFGSKVYKIPVSIADECPNRKGLKGMQTCTFCDVWGSAARVEAFDLSLRNQISTFMERIAQNVNAENFLVYFQAYTSTFMQLKQLREHFDTALEFENVKGFVIGTRPDCLSKAVLATWNEYGQRSHVAVELGAQSFYDEHLEFVRRGHSALKTLQAVYRIRRECPNVQLGLHFIFGMPGETEQQIKATAELCSRLPIDDVKIHNLHVLTQTPLAELYHQGQFRPIELEDYTERVGIFLRHLDPRIAVHRLAAQSPRPEELIAPQWTGDKMRTYQFIKSFLLRDPRGFQGSQCDSIGQALFSEQQAIEFAQASQMLF